jgi:CHAT domain-containing protein
MAGSWDSARANLDKSISQAREARNIAVEAASLNNLGSLLSAQGDQTNAQLAYRQSVELAHRVSQPILATKALTNAGRLSLEAQNYTEAATFLTKAQQETRNLSDSHDKAFSLIALGELFLKLHDSARDSVSPKSSRRWLSLAYQAFDDAASIADELGDLRAESYALGHLGQLYAAQQRRVDALRLTRRAIFAAQQANAPEILYRWQWQTGRLLKAQGDIDQAISAYRQAVFNLQAVRHDLSLTYAGRQSSFRQAIEPVFFELADLLLQRPSANDDPEQLRRYLLEARDTVEQLKTAELEDYFQDDCVAALQSRVTPLDRLKPRTAVIYPILLQDRTELLLSLPQGIEQVTVPVARSKLTQEVRAFRTTLEKRTTREYLPHAQTLYDWLIRPLEPLLEKHAIQTLVIVPDGPLRTIPMAPLHSGEDYLISHYALAVTPGLSLTDHRPSERKNVRLLANGLTEAVQGFPPLEFVSLELEAVERLYGGTRLQDKEFLIPNVRQQLTETPYSIVHIASHGQFTSNADESFLLTFDGRLTMDRLEEFMGLSQFRENPVELLTLSACQSAAGDDRAALGLAGVAVKAGARSALATLWFINDQASAQLVAEFYQQLQDPKVSKAQALQQAQLKLLSERRYRHPGYWSPFLLIGNWL